MTFPKGLHLGFSKKAVQPSSRAEPEYRTPDEIEEHYLREALRELKQERQHPQPPQPAAPTAPAK